MTRPAFAFRTATHTAYALDEPGVYRLDPGGAQLVLSLEAQEVPPEVLSPALERVVMAWVIARGGRELNLNGKHRPINPADLDRPAAGMVKRLISIAPSNAEIVGALGATELLVAVESSSDFPPEILQLPRLGPDLNVDLEALESFNPDLVLASLTVPGMERNIAGLDARGLPMLVLAPRTLKEIFQGVLQVGRALGRESVAQGTTDAMLARISQLKQARDPARTPRRVYLEWWPKPMFSPGAACWSNELIALAGGENVFQSIATQSGEVRAEDVAQADPEVIFVSWCGVPCNKLKPERVLQRPGLENVTAVRRGHVYPIDESLLGRPGPRVLAGVEQMARAIRKV